MGFQVSLFGFCLVVLTSLATPLSVRASGAEATPTPLPSNAWSKVAYPTLGNTESIGFYSNGCIAGAKALPLNGDGYQVMRPERNRYYGNPELIRLVQDLGIMMEAMGSGLLVSDMGQPRGGPMPYGHASHQVGLDVDVWYWTHPEQAQRSLTLVEREKLPMPSVLNGNGVVDPKKFGREQILKVKMAAESELVQRIFVNPAIKAYLCSSLPANELYWLHKLRPWPGHDSHFHIRIFCPKSDENCTKQDEAPAGDGCAELLPPRGPTLELDGGSGDHVESNQPLLEVFFKTADTLPAACAKLLKQR